MSLNEGQDIRVRRCFELKLSTVDLDDMAGTKEYFHRGTWRRAKSFDYARIAAGVQRAGGSHVPGLVALVGSIISFSVAIGAGLIFDRSALAVWKSH
jgi:hypothetical protein